MALEFRHVTLLPIRDLTAVVPPGAVVGLIGENGSGQQQFLRLAAGLDRPASGEVICAGSRRYLGRTAALDLSPADVIVIHHTFASQDAIARARAAREITRLRAAGSTVLLATHEGSLVHQICDEVWWFDCGMVVHRGDAREAWDAYQEHVAAKLRALGGTTAVAVAPAHRRGDGRAEIVALETVGSDDQPTTVWRSGEAAVIRLTIRFREPIPNPVVGIMIRTRIGFEVYGTNTELEKVTLGSCQAGDTVQLDFAFRCELCPNEYTVTAASHDPDGTAHDWMDDAVAVTVTDSRYTAGVANLRAAVSVRTHSCA